MIILLFVLIIIALIGVYITAVNSRLLLKEYVIPNLKNILNLE